MFGPSASSGMPTTLRAVTAQQADRAVVGRRLGEHDVAGLQHVQAEELDDLQRAVAGEHAIGRHASATRPAIRAAAESPSDGPYCSIAAPLVLKDRSGRIDELLNRKRLVGGHSAREVDGVHGPRIIDSLSLFCGKRVLEGQARRPARGLNPFQFGSK